MFTRTVKRNASTMLRPLRLTAFLIILAFDFDAIQSVRSDCPNNVDGGVFFDDHGSQIDLKQCGKGIFSRRKHLVEEKKALEHKLNLSRENLQECQQNATDMVVMLMTNLTDCSAEIQRCNASLDKNLRQSEASVNNLTQIQVSLEAENKECAQNVSKLEKTNDDLQKAYDTCFDDLATMNQNEELMNKTCTENKQQCDNVSQSQRMALAEKTEQIQLLQIADGECKKNISQLNEINDNLQRAFNQCSENSAYANETLEVTKANYTVEIQRCSNDSQSIQEESDKRLERIQALEKENEACTENSGKLNETNGDLQKASDKCFDDLATLNRTLQATNKSCTAEKQKCHNDLQSKQVALDTKLEEIRDVRKKYDKCRNGNRVLNEDNKNLQGKYATCLRDSSINKTSEKANEICAVDIKQCFDLPQIRDLCSPREDQSGRLYTIQPESLFRISMIFKFIILLLLVYEVFTFHKGRHSCQILVYLIASTVIIIVIDLFPKFVLYTWS